MSNTDDEVADCIEVLKTAHGKCFIGGLGLGWITIMAAKKPEIKSIVVVEINKWIIAKSIPFVRRFLTDEEFSKITVICDDATINFHGYDYNWMYFDTWLEPDDIGKRTMLKCFKNAKPYLAKNGVLECWLRWRLENNVDLQ